MTVKAENQQRHQIILLQIATILNTKILESVNSNIMLINLIIMITKEMFLEGNLVNIPVRSLTPI